MQVSTAGPGCCCDISDPNPVLASARVKSTHAAAAESLSTLILLLEESEKGVSTTPSLPFDAEPLHFSGGISH